MRSNNTSTRTISWFETRYAGMVRLFGFPASTARAARRALYRTCQARREVLKVAIGGCFSSMIGDETGLNVARMNSISFRNRTVSQANAAVGKLTQPWGLPSALSPDKTIREKNPLPEAERGQEA